LRTWAPTSSGPLEYLLGVHWNTSPRGYKSYLRKSPLSIRQYKYSVRGFSIPQVTIKTGLTTPDGREEQLAEYLCDHPNCPNIATHVLGCVREIGTVAAVCDEHAPKPRC